MTTTCSPDARQPIRLMVVRAFLAWGRYRLAWGLSLTQLQNLRSGHSDTLGPRTYLVTPLQGGVLGYRWQHGTQDDLALRIRIS
jgi:hypothetical protein